MNTKDDSFEHDNLSDKEKEEAKENGFILVGKKGVGKTTIINSLFNKAIGKIIYTEISKVYYYKLKNGHVITLIDTPGLENIGGTESETIDQIHLKEITKAISEEHIHIKGIFFLVNFQNPRFDSDEQEALLKYIRLFPLKNFWKSLVIIYTHF